MDGAFVQPIKVHGHARIMKVAGKQHEHFLDQLIVKKVKTTRTAFRNSK